MENLTLDIIAVGCLMIAVLLLIILSVIDMRIRLLPNELVLGFATASFVFHLVTICKFLSIQSIFFGAIIGFGTLYLIRTAANKYYGEDALGLGDVKLMGAAGLWLGIDGILFALTAGALAGLIHGVLYAFYISWQDKTPVNFHRLSIPAGPGFAVGIVFVGTCHYGAFTAGVFNALLP